MDFEGKVAVVTGGASGIGFGLAEQAARRGMTVVLADVEDASLEDARSRLCDTGARVEACRTDVTQRDQVEALADRAFALGPVGLLCNNAGVNVTVTRPFWQYSGGDWEWLTHVNLWGVIHGVRSFLPRLMEQPSRSHILNTSSSAGLMAGPGLAIYKVTKHAVLSLSETLYHDLMNAGANVGVSVFCPDVVKTRLRDAGRNRPAALRDEAPRTPEEAAAEQALRAATGLEPSEAARIAFEGVDAGRLYLYTHPSALEFARERLADLESGIPKPKAALRTDILPGR